MSITMEKSCSGAHFLLESVVPIYSVLVIGFRCRILSFRGWSPGLRSCVCFGKGIDV